MELSELVEARTAKDDEAERLYRERERAYDDLREIDGKIIAIAQASLPDCGKETTYESKVYRLSDTKIAVVEFVKYDGDEEWQITDAKSFEIPPL